MNQNDKIKERNIDAVLCKSILNFLEKFVLKNSQVVLDEDPCM